jgi:hypothetical protein
MAVSVINVSMMGCHQKAWEKSSASQKAMILTEEDQGPL